MNAIPRIQSAYRCETGKVRDRNEDSCTIVETALGGHFQMQPFGLYAVADGMGGHMEGHIASNAAVRAFSAYMLDKLYIPMLKAKKGAPEPDVLDTMERAVLVAHDAVFRPSPDENGGTTLTAALIFGQHLHIAHVGDSRAYWLANGALTALTKDHSLVRKLQDRGQLTEEEAHQYQYRNVLLQALGQDIALTVDTFSLDLPQQGWLLLCSDGLCGFVPDADMQSILETSVSADEAANRLCEAAMAAGGPDNITAVVVRFAS